MIHKPVQSEVLSPFPGRDDLRWVHLTPPIGGPAGFNAMF